MWSSAGKSRRLTPTLAFSCCNGCRVTMVVVLPCVAMVVVLQWFVVLPSLLLVVWSTPSRLPLQLPFVVYYPACACVYLCVGLAGFRAGLRALAGVSASCVVLVCAYAALSVLCYFGLPLSSVQGCVFSDLCLAVEIALSCCVMRRLTPFLRILLFFFLSSLLSLWGF